MADKFTKTEEPAGLEEDDWKDVPVTKEHQPDLPEKQISNHNYRNMERDLTHLDAEITRLDERKTALEAEMVKVKAAAEA